MANTAWKYKFAGRKGFDSGDPTLAFSWNPSNTNTALPTGATFSRASTATYVDSTTGLVTTAAVDTPRFTSAGFLAEGAITNVCKRSETLDNATWVKTGIGIAAAPTVTANFGTAPDGNATADRVQFPAISAGTDGSTLTQGISVTSGRHSLSVWAKTNSGGPSTVYLALWDGATSWLQTTITVTSTWTRFMLENQNLTTATWQVFVGVDRTHSSSQAAQSAADLLLWGFQLEKQRTTSSYTGATGSGNVSRSADLLTAPTGITGNVWSMAATVTAFTSFTGVQCNLLQWGTAGAANSVTWSNNSTTNKLDLSVTDNASGNLDVQDTATLPATASRCIATSNAGTITTKVSTSSSATQTGSGTGLLTSPSSTLLLGDGSGTPLRGYITQIVIRNDLNAS